MAKFYIPDKSSMKEGANLIEKILNLSNVQRILGIYEFITGQNYSVCCKSIDLCLIQKLSFENFIAAIRELKIWVHLYLCRNNSRNCNTAFSSTKTSNYSTSYAYSAFSTTLKPNARNFTRTKGSDKLWCNHNAMARNTNDAPSSAGT